MNYRNLLLIIFIILPLTIVTGQYYDTGTDPSSVKWLQIKTGRFTVIYPESYGKGGEAFAQSLDEAYAKLVTLFPEKKFNIPIVIHSLTTESNGYVAWAPARMEIYPTPEQNTIPMEMNKQLALHELAHVFQMESLNQGFSKALSVIVGEQATGLVASVLPLWFFEGDAVFAETYLSNSGRGRSPSFQKQVKALTVEKENFYNYSKSIHGSFKDFVPDHYSYGYQIVTWAMAKNDPQIWNKVISYSARHPYFINPVNISLAKNASLTKAKLFNQSFDSLKSVWTKDYKKETPVTYKTLNPVKNGKYINYHSPVSAGSDTIIAIKTSLSAPPEFVLINPVTKKEKRIHTPGQMSPWFISAAKGKIVWVEAETDIRWENRGFSVIKLLDLKTGETRKITSKSRYLAASISPDGKLICAVENTISNKNNLVLINAETGKAELTVPSPENCYLQRPQWDFKGERITAIMLTEHGEGIIAFTPESYNWDILIEPSNEDLQSSFLRNDSLFFVSSKSGTENIYLKGPDKKIICLTKSAFGTSDFILTGDNLIFSDYTSSGDNIATSNLDNAEGSKTVSSSSFLINRFNYKNTASDSVFKNTYTPEPYRKWQHPFRFHSWMPFYADLEKIKTDPASIRPGVTLLTQNNLSTLISTIGYEYSREKNHVFHSRVTWQGLFPVIKSQLDYGDDPQIYKTGVSIGDPAEINPAFRFTNSIAVPLQFSSGRFSEFLQPYFSWEYSNKYIYLQEGAAGGSYDYGQSILSGRLYFSNYHRSAMRDLYPRWAQVIDLNYSFAPFDKLIYGTASSVSTAFYFPGFLPNNGIKIRFEKEKQNPAKYLFSSGISFPRGYRDIISKDINFLSADYVLPLLYPDLSLASLMYIKRIRGGVFYDYASGTGNYYYNRSVNGTPTNDFHNFNETFSSFGFEVIADFYVLRIPYMISAGVETVLTKADSKPIFSLLFNIDLFGRILGKRGY
jgi:hypothetical protein